MYYMYVVHLCTCLVCIPSPPVPVLEDVPGINILYWQSAAKEASL
jgi:hypothetical protein